MQFIYFLFQKFVKIPQIFVKFFLIHYYEIRHICIISNIIKFTIYKIKVHFKLPVYKLYDMK